MAYGVREGVVVISSPELIHELLESTDPIFSTGSPLQRMIRKAERGELEGDEVDQLKSMIEAHILIEQPVPTGEGGFGGGALN